jgi:PAS domain S-box-containing protein
MLPPIPSCPSCPCPAMAVHRSWWRLICRGAALGVLLCVLTLGIAGATADQPKRVLLVYQEEMSSPAERAVDSGIRSILGNQLEFQFYSEHLDQSLFPDPKFQAAQAAWFRNKYRDRKIDLVIAIGLVPREFLPNIPTILCTLEPTELLQMTLPANSTAVWLSADFKRTLAAAARLQPTARQVVVLSGTSDWDRQLEAAARKTLPPNGTNWEINYWDDMSVQEIRSRLGKLPKDTIVLYISIERDGAGQSYIPRDLVPALSAASSAPIYGLSDGFIGFGIVGGSVVSFEEQGKQVAEMGQRILRGEKPSDIHPVASNSSYVFDWRQLHRFGLSESRLPPGSVVRFAVPSPWQLYRRWIVGGVAFILLQTAFIAYLLVQRRRRRRAESSLGYEVRFESLVSALSATFANVPTDRTGGEIVKGLEKLREFLDLDRVSLFESNQDDSHFGLRCTASIVGVPPGLKSFSCDELPWFVESLRQGKNCVIRSPADLPPDAQKERDFLVERDYRFLAIVPLRGAGLSVGSLVFISFHDGTWTDKVIQQFQVVAEVFANVLVRTRIEDGLLESQQRFQTMADTAPVMIWMAGTDKLCTFFNKQWLEFTGRKLEQELGNGWSEDVHPNDLAQCLRIYVSSFDARLPFAMEYRLRRADGDYGWVFDTGVPRYTPAGEFAGYIGSCMDISDRKRAEEGLLDLSGRLINAQEEERTRIARELHDDFSQRLALLAIQLGQVSQGLPDSDKALIESLHIMWEKTTELSADVHKLSHRLHSSKLHHVGLLAAAKSLCEETSRHHELQIEFAHGDMPEEIAPNVALCFFRIIQEALNNIVKHSGAKRAQVNLSTEDSRICLRIVDAGVGFDTGSRKARAGLGLASMRERLRIMGGSIMIRSRPMEGTEIQAEAPLPGVAVEANFPSSFGIHGGGTGGI